MSDDAYRSTPIELEEYSTEGTDPLALEKTYHDLLAGIVFCGLVFGVILFLAFPDARFYHLLGLFIGVSVALVSAWNLRSTVEAAIDIGELGAEREVKKGALIRYAIICIVLGIMMIFPVGNPLTGFLGVMTLKVAAYIQPFTNKAIKILKIRR